MNKQTEALKMAIEALLYGANHTEAVKACKEALAQPQSDEYTEGYQQGYVEGWEAKKAEQPASKNIRESFNEMLDDKVEYYKGKQPAQEPVAWMYFDEAYKKACNSSQPQDWMDAALMAQQVRCAHPAPQPAQEPVLLNVKTHDDKTYKVEVSAPSWQGLSVYDILSIDGLDCVDENDLISFARAIEQALKEKNKC